MWFALALALLACLLAACSSGGSDAGPTPTPAATSTPRAEGFLPTPTSTPTPPDTIEGPGGLVCPPLPRPACACPGEMVNLYRGLSMQNVIALAVMQGLSARWVLGPADVQRLMRMFDRDVAVAAYSLSVGSKDEMRLHVVWADTGSFPFTPIDFVLDPARGVAGEPGTGLQMQLPEGFVDALFAALQDVTPTPAPPAPTWTPTATVVPARAVFFHHPDGRLAWDGPDARVHSMAEGHCGSFELKQDFGVPGYIGVGDDLGFWSDSAVRREDGWRYTGYSHGDWQLWQGDDGLVVYLVYAPDPRVAFEYRSYGCI